MSHFVCLFVSDAAVACHVDVVSSDDDELERESLAARLGVCPPTGHVRLHAPPTHTSITMSSHHLSSQTEKPKQRRWDTNVNINEYKDEVLQIRYYQNLTLTHVYYCCVCWLFGERHCMRHGSYLLVVCDIQWLECWCGWERRRLCSSLHSPSRSDHHVSVNINLDVIVSITVSGDFDIVLCIDYCEAAGVSVSLSLSIY